MEQVLIVDDSPAARMIARRCLQIAGVDSARCVEAENGRSALEVLKAGTVSLVVADLNMPVMNGETLLRYMQSSPRLNRIPVVVVSSLVNAATEARLQGLGATVVMRKPLSPVAMVEALQQVARARGAA